MFDKVKINKYGFYQLKSKPSEAELEKYYKDIYFQEAKGSYEKEYTQQELEYINNKLEQKFKIVEELINTNNEEKYRFLDIGCGEGWSLDFFISKNWEVTGLDFSSWGLSKFNPNVSNYHIKGDVYKNIDKLIQEERKYQCIYMINVLEHVLQPLALLEKCYKLLSDKGVLLIQVPNDFSDLQQYFMKNKIINNPFWICVPDHISYFNTNGLINICKEAKLKKEKVLSDFPIDLNLFNINTNYIKDKSKGKECHKSRIEIENFMSRISVEKVNNLYEALADMGLGRNIIGYFTKKS